jgi:hypothetical protein
MDVKAGGAYMGLARGAGRAGGAVGILLLLGTSINENDPTATTLTRSVPCVVRRSQFANC